MLAPENSTTFFPLLGLGVDDLTEILRRAIHRADDRANYGGEA
jgi:hypothetical protein